MKIDFDAAFIRLNEELAEANQMLELVCAGGYVLQRHGYRATSDVDAFYTSNDKIDEIIKNVGDEFGLNTPGDIWLNNSVLSLNPEPPDEHCVLVHQFSNLVVKEVSIQYLIGMKLFSQRLQDIRDAASILKQDKNTQPFELFATLTDMNFDIDISVLLEAYEIAHGMDWLSNFYAANSEELRKYF